MDNQRKIPNNLLNEASPYLLQHAYNPVHWYPWGETAFQKAKAEDKPIFLSIGYSTCHWCHVMARESFEDEETAGLLNESFISIKVDKEERPDIDSIYMSVCQALTGSGGWPTSIFMTPEQKPFFAGTYFPPEPYYNRMSFKDILNIIREKWSDDRERLLHSANTIVASLQQESGVYGKADRGILESALALYQNSFDTTYGGFGDAPKFPTPHNLLFLLQYYEKRKDRSALKMVERTLIQMYRGGMFDHIGYGFSRYSTDRFFLVPHFEKMLYDNALLLLVCCRAYGITENVLYKDIAIKTATYIIREMTDRDGGFYSAQDADSEGEEGKYYVFSPSEILDVLGTEEGTAFNSHYDISEEGNFEGKSIPNLLKSDVTGDEFERLIPKVYEYRKHRFRLHIDDKILTSWNSLMIAGMCQLYRISGNSQYLATAERAEAFVEQNLCRKDTLFVSCRKEKLGKKGFLDDYANYIFGLLTLYEVTLKKKYLERAQVLCKKVIRDFWDEKQKGFYLYGNENEQLIMRPKETYDGAVPSGNSMMAYNLVRLGMLTSDDEFRELQRKQLDFMSGHAAEYPAGYAMFLIALSDYLDPPEMITVVKKEGDMEEDMEKLPLRMEKDCIIRILLKETAEFPLINDKTTYYICKNHSCQPPVNEI